MIKISHVKDNSQCHEKGIEEGHYIFEVNGEEIRNEFHFLATIEKAKLTSKQIQTVVFKGNTPSIIYFDADSSLGVQFVNEKRDHYRYSLDIDFFDVFIFLLTWLVLILITFGLALPFFTFYLARFIINNTTKHKQNANNTINQTKEN